VSLWWRTHSGRRMRPSMHVLNLIAVHCQSLDDFAGTNAACTQARLPCCMWMAGFWLAVGCCVGVAGVVCTLHMHHPAAPTAAWLLPCACMYAGPSAQTSL
jgi:hypothetical protein